MYSIENIPEIAITANSQYYAFGVCLSNVASTRALVDKYYMVDPDVIEEALQDRSDYLLSIDWWWFTVFVHF